MKRDWPATVVRHNFQCKNVCNGRKIGRYGRSGQRLFFKNHVNFVRREWQWMVVLAKKTFSGYSSALLGELYYDFEPGVTYRGVANFYAGGETDTMDETFSF